MLGQCSSVQKGALGCSCSHCARSVLRSQCVSSLQLGEGSSVAARSQLGGGGEAGQPHAASSAQKREEFPLTWLCVLETNGDIQYKVTMLSPKSRNLHLAVISCSQSDICYVGRYLGIWVGEEEGECI